jgi:hypothetical protein
MSRAPAFVPQLDLLEDRCVPSCVVRENAGVLLIRGDDTRHLIVINDGGGSSPGNINVICDGKTTNSKNPIREIKVRTGSGADSITYNLTGRMASNLVRMVDVDLGAGDDVFNANLSTSLQTGSVLKLHVLGGPGNNHINVTTSSSFNVPAGALFQMNLDGGTDMPDKVQVNFAGQLVGTIVMRELGEGPFQTLYSTFTLNSNSTGIIHARAFGGPGMDDLQMRAVKPAATDTGALDGAIDGGLGVNFCRHTRDVRVRNCQLDFPV